MSRVRIVFLSVACVVLCGQVAAQDQEIPVVAVFEIENRGSPLSGDHLITLTDYLGTKLGERGKYRIIPRQEIRARLTEQKKESFKACYDQSCQIEIGRELAAEFTVSSSIGRVGTLCLITASMYDLRKAATARTATAKGPCQVEQLVDAIEDVADKLQGQPAAAKPKPEPEKATPLPPPPPLVVRKVPEGPMLSDVFTDIHLMMTMFAYIGGDMKDPETVQVGFDSTLDFRLGKMFTLGPLLRLTVSDFTIFELSIRAGLLLEVTKRLFFHPYILAGFTYETVDLTTETIYQWDLVGFHVRGGIGLKWMFSHDFGLALDVIAGFSSGFAVESDAPPDSDGQAVEVSTNLGLVIGW